MKAVLLLLVCSLACLQARDIQPPPTDQESASARPLSGTELALQDVMLSFEKLGQGIKDAMARIDKMRDNIKQALAEVHNTTTADP